MQDTTRAVFWQLKKHKRLCYNQSQRSTNDGRRLHVVSSAPPGRINQSTPSGATRTRRNRRSFGQPLPLLGHPKIPAAHSRQSGGVLRGRYLPRCPTRKLWQCRGDMPVAGYPLPVDRLPMYSPIWYWQPVRLGITCQSGATGLFTRRYMHLNRGDRQRHEVMFPGTQCRGNFPKMRSSQRGAPSLDC